MSKAKIITGEIVGWGEIAEWVSYEDYKQLEAHLDIEIEHSRDLCVQLGDEKRMHDKAIAKWTEYLEKYQASEQKLGAARVQLTDIYDLLGIGRE